MLFSIACSMTAFLYFLLYAFISSMTKVEKQLLTSYTETILPMTNISCKVTEVRII